MQKENELLSKLNGARKEINDLRGRLNEIDRQKESWFRKKEECGGKIKGLIKQVKEKRDKRDSLTKKVKEGKEKRNQINEKIKKNISQLKKLNEEKNSLIKKHDIKADPSKIKGEIDKLELKIETEVMSFEKEQKIVKRIKELKRRFDDVKVLNDFLEKNSGLSKETDKLSKEAKALHMAIQENARQSQSMHEELVAGSVEIDRLKASEEEAFLKFSVFKKEFTELNNKLKDKLKDYGSINSEMQKISREKEEKMIEGREEIVREKIRKGQKLTNEDLLMFQKPKK